MPLSFEIFDVNKRNLRAEGDIGTEVRVASAHLSGLQGYEVLWLIGLLAKF